MKRLPQWKELGTCQRLCMSMHWLTLEQRRVIVRIFNREFKRKRKQRA